MADSSSTRLMQLVVMCPFSYPVEKPPLQLLCLVVTLMHYLSALFCLYAEKIIIVVAPVFCDKPTIGM